MRCFFSRCFLLFKILFLKTINYIEIKIIMKRLLLNVLVVFSLMLVGQMSSSAQTVYTMCSIAGNSTTDSTGVLYDSGGPAAQYQNSEDCTLLVAPPCAVSITLVFDTFATESGFDFFKVYDGATVAATQLMNTSGSTLPTPVTCTSGYMLIVWHSDGSVLADGFRCHWSSVIASAVAPTAALSVSDVTPPLNTNIQFTDQSVGGPTTWLWDFGDGDTSHRQNPLHAYGAPGTYNIMFVSFSCTESDTAYTSVTVQSAPQINVDPDSLVVTAQCGDSTSYIMDVTNIAGGELFWTSDADVNTGLPVRVLSLKMGTNQFLNYPNTIQAIDTFFQNYTLTEEYRLNPSLISSLLFGKNVLLIPSQEVKNNLLDTFWINMAPVIQNFLNNGGSVIYCGSNGALSDAMFNTGIFTGSFANDAIFDNLTVVDPTHPLVQGLTLPFTAPSATYTMNLTNPDKNTVIDDQGTDVVSWLPYGSGKAIFVAFDYFEDASLNASRILANAVQWGGLNGLPSWISLSQNNDTVNATDTTHVVVTFQTTGLPAGTYIAAIPVASNDPAQPVILVPCTLTITGDPIIALSDTCVDFGSVMQYRPELRDFNVLNNGCDTLFVTNISSNAPEFIVSAPFTYLIPGAQGTVNVSFTSNTVGTFNGTISILNNDIDTSVCMSATTFAAPDINTSTSSVSVSIPACGATGTTTFDVANVGGTDLVYTVSNLPSWMTFTTTGDTVTAGSSQTVTLTFNSGTLVGGNYTVNINVISNDPRTSSVPIAVTFTVGQNPCVNYTFQTNTCTGETNFTSTSINTPTSYSWNFGDFTSLGTTANPTHYYAYNANYTVQLIACNAAGCDTVTQTVQAIITGPQPTSCYPTTSAYCCGIGLTNVTLGTINKNSNDAIEGYQNYTCSDTTSLEIGQSYSLSAQTGFVYPESVLAWIDWNNDTQLDPVTEQVFTDNNVLTFHAGTITVPGNAVIDQPLRFRIASDYSANPTPAPCLNLQFGQVEDYSIFVRLPVKVDEIGLNVPFSVFPNPFAGSTRIEYQLNNSATISLEVYNVVGEKIQSLASVEKQNAGKHTFNFEGTTPGIYTVRLTVDGQTIVKKVVKL